MSKVWVGYHVCPEVIKQVNFLDMVMASSFLTRFPGSRSDLPVFTGTGNGVSYGFEYNTLCCSKV